MEKYFKIKNHPWELLPRTHRTLFLSLLLIGIIDSFFYGGLLSFLQHSNCHALLVGALGDVVLVTDIDHQDIFYSPLTGNILSPLPLSNVTAPVGIAFGPCDDHVYWTDSEHHLVARSTIDGKKQEIIRSNVTEPTGMDLDLVGGHVYWINRGDSTIEVSKLNGDYWKVLVSNVTSGPFDIGLDPTRG